MKENRTQFLENLAQNETVVSAYEKKFQNGSFKVNIAEFDTKAQDVLRARLQTYTKPLRGWYCSGMHKETGTSRFLGWLSNNKKYIPALLSCVRESSDAMYKNVENFVRKHCLVAFFEDHNISYSDIVWSLDILPPAWTENLA